MQKHLRDQVHRKVSHFILGEEGKVGCRSAFSAAAFIGATSLAGVLLSAPDAAAGNCGGGANCNGNWSWCCVCWNAEISNTGCIQGTYICQQMPPDDPGVSCWVVN